MKINMNRYRARHRFVGLAELNRPCVSQRLTISPTRNRKEVEMLRVVYHYF